LRRHGRLADLRELRTEAQPPAVHAKIEWARAAWQEMHRFSTGGTYGNFLAEEEGEERIQAAPGKNHDRLVEIKTTWDPGNLFRMNKNIAPRPP
jgi:hypothetical protein